MLVTVLVENCETSVMNKQYTTTTDELCEKHPLFNAIYDKMEDFDTIVFHEGDNTYTVEYA